MVCPGLISGLNGHFQILAKRLIPGIITQRLAIAIYGAFVVPALGQACPPVMLSQKVIRQNLYRRSELSNCLAIQALGNVCIAKIVVSIHKYWNQFNGSLVFSNSSV